MNRLEDLIKQLPRELREEVKDFLARPLAATKFETISNDEKLNAQNFT
ncbi:hypothetical protein BPIT_28730 [Candidatus Brocadia pituitae]|nr:hypothetical protein BPIT_28730 [Candidatus Brocadia pituitae]